MTIMGLSIVILAAGRGKRMQSEQPKVLQPLAGMPLLEHVTTTATELGADQIHVIVGFGSDLVKSELSHLDVNWIEQKEQLGTGDAVAKALPFIDDAHQVLTLVGDIPLISSQTLRALLDKTPAGGLGLVTAELDNPAGFGRILRNDSHEVTRIIEDKDATPEQKSINEVNTGIIVANAKNLKTWIPALKNNNAQSEYYLTDIIEEAVKDGQAIHTVKSMTPHEVQGVNDPWQLITLERLHQQQQAKKLMEQGVRIMDPARFDLRGNLSCGKEVTIDINVIIEGNVTIGSNCYIGPNTLLRHVHIADNVRVRANSFIEEADIKDNCVIGPFARIRPGTTLKEGARVGNFVEIKKSTVGENSKINHLSYVGDTTIGKDVNVGAGTITCNYDGVNKHQTHIGDNAFIGSGTQLVAPVTIGPNATIGAGSTITEDSPENELTLARAKQVTVKDWEKPSKKEK